MSHADDIEDSSAPLIEHLAELRTRLIRSVLAFVVAMIFAFRSAARSWISCWSRSSRPCAIWATPIR